MVSLSAGKSPGNIAPLILSSGISNGIPIQISQRLRKGSESCRQELIRSVCGFNVPLRKTTRTRMRSVSGLNVRVRRAMGTRNFRRTGSGLKSFARKREAGIALSTEEDAEEAHRNARFGCYAEGPEQTARRRRRHLEVADDLFRKNRFFKVGRTAPLSRKECNDLWLLRWLFPPLYRKSQLTAEAQAEADANKANRHPFHDEAPAVDGNFYPHDSKLRPASADEPDFVEFAEVPKYCIYKPGRPPIFTDELPIDLPNDRSALTSTLVPIPRSF